MELEILCAYFFKRSKCFPFYSFGINPVSPNWICWLHRNTRISEHHKFLPLLLNSSHQKCKSYWHIDIDFRLFYVSLIIYFSGHDSSWTWMTKGWNINSIYCLRDSFSLMRISDIYNYHDVWENPEIYNSQFFVELGNVWSCNEMFA